MIGRIRGHLARAEYVQALALGKAGCMEDDVPPAERTEAAVLAAEAAHQLGHFPEAAELGRRAAEMARACKELDLEGRAWLRLSSTLEAMDDHVGALEAGRTFLRGLTHDWSLLAPLQGRAYITVGMACRGKNLAAESLQAFWQALQQFKSAGNREEQVRVRHLMAWVLAEQGDHDDAEEHLFIAQELISQGVSEHCKVDQLMHLSYLRLCQGRYFEAHTLATELLDPGRSEVLLVNRAVAYCVLGMCELLRGEAAEARKMWQLGHTAASECGKSEVLGLVFNLGREIMAVVGPMED